MLRCKIACVKGTLWGPSMVLGGVGMVVLFGPWLLCLLQPWGPLVLPLLQATAVPWLQGLPLSLLYAMAPRRRRRSTEAC